ncbi:hypothetical protein SDC9_211295 [bioreactor metagenome]|uniref:F5/8 type C domain-containing protein n=1 Tax=bioreactor metagenome TaxID=1076179 RepID=A0A645JIU7_9ZZZZ
MLYEKKRTFGLGPIDLATAAFAMVGQTGASANIYAGDLAVNATPATAGALDYEEANQHFPEENTLEIYGWETAASSGGASTLTVILQSSADGDSWKDEFTLSFLEDDIVKDALMYRSTIPAHAKRYMRLVLVVGTEAMTAGQILAMVRPL